MDLKPIFQSVVDGQADAVASGVKAALAAGVEANVILNEALIAAMDDVGCQFEEGELFVPEMLVSARAMQAGLSLLKPHLAVTDTKSSGKVAIGTVKGDLHDIGKNLVCMMLEGAGLKVVDIGIDVDPAKFVEQAKINNARVIGVSALLTTTMTNMKAVVDAVKESGINAKVMIGGAPVTQAFCDEIGADGYAPDAASAADLAVSLL